MKKYYKYAIVFFAPIFIFCIGLFLNKIAPFGDYIIGVYDSQYQYPAFFTALKNFHLFSFNIGLGFNLLGTATYYLMSPLNQLIRFFDIYHYNTFYFTLIVLKIGLCGVTMQYFLTSENKKDNWWSVLFSIIYALMGYITTYYYNTFWIDGIIMLPLILVGINKIVDKKNPLFYIISLSISITLSYYTGYMSCIFSVIYFIYKLIEKNAYKDKKIIINFLISSILCGVIAAIVIIPSYFALMNGKADGFNYSYTNYWAFNSNIKYFFYSFSPGNYQSSQVMDGFAQNFCTLFIVILFIFSFFNKRISKKTKIITLIIILFYITSYSFNLIDYAWQMFQKPVWWQHRYSFTLSTFMIIVAYKNLVNFDDLNINLIKKIVIFMLLSISILVGFYCFYNNSTLKHAYRLFIIAFSILILINYIFLFDQKNKINKVFIISLIISEIFLNTFISIKANNFQSTLAYDMLAKQRATNSIDKIKKSDNSFYRSELTYPYTTNDGLLFNYYGINYFNSVRNKDVINLLENYLGLFTDSHSRVQLVDFDPYILSLLDVKYLMGSEKLNYYENIDEQTHLNQNNIGLGFLVDSSIKDIKLNDGMYYKNISNIYSKMLNHNYNLYHKFTNTTISLDNASYNKEKDYYEKDDKSKNATAITSFTADRDCLLIIDDSTVVTKTFINDEEIKQGTTYPLLKEGDKVRIEHPFMKEYEEKSIVSFHYIDIKELNEVTSMLNKNTLTNIKINEEHLLKAEITNNDDNKILFTSIPYEKGMTIKVNGKKVNPIILLNSLIGLELNKGKNVITIDYRPPGLLLGTIISILGISSTYAFIKIFKKKKQDYRQRKNNLI